MAIFPGPDKYKAWESMPDEEWRAIPGFDGLYDISSLGRVVSFVSNHGKPSAPHILSPGSHQQGYLMVSLTSNGTIHQRRVHRLVAMTFIGSPPFDGAWALHKNDDNTDNRPENLYWGTINDNARDALVNGRRVAKLNVEAVKDICRRLNAGETVRSLAAEYKVSQNRIADVARGTAWRGFGESVTTKLGKRQDGAANDMAKLTAADVVSIRRRCAAGESQAALAREFGVNHSNVSMIVNRKTWRTVA